MNRKILTLKQSIMKKLFFFCALLVSVTLQSAPTWLGREAMLVQNFIGAHQLSITIDESSGIHLMSDNGKDVLAYVFNGKDGGYVVVSANESIVPVICYSETGVYEEGSPLDDIIKADLQWRVAHLADIPVEQRQKAQKEREELMSRASGSRTILQWPPQGYTNGGGWVAVNWNQSAPYNNFCPIKISTSERSVAGCPAIAMGQILVFHQTINQTRFNASDRYYHNYTQSFWIDDAWETYQFLSFDSLNTYLDIIDQKFASNQAFDNNDKAALSLAAGYACKSVYDPAGSGTYAVSQAYDAYQRFGFTESILMDTTFSNDEIVEKMINNIKKARPVHLATVDVNWASGHNVVCDGYRDNGFFRLNMGWGGTYNNWYRLPDEFPMGLTVFEGIVADIKAVPNQTEYTLNLLADPDNIGVVLVGDGSYVDGYPVPFSAPEIAGVTFIGWEGTEEDLALIDNPSLYTSFITMPQRNVTLTAKYAPSYQVNFTVRNADQTPINGASISVSGQSGSFVTNADGYASIQLVNGSYNFSVTANDYLDFNSSFDVNNENADVEVTLISNGLAADKASNLRVGPVPFNEFLLVESGNAKRISNVSLLTLIGNQLMEFDATEKNSIRINTSELNPGIYFLILIMDDGQRIVKKVIKN